MEEEVWVPPADRVRLTRPAWRLAYSVGFTLTDEIAEGIGRIRATLHRPLRYQHAPQPVPDRRPGLRADRLDKAARPHRHRSPLGTQTAAAAALLSGRAHRPRGRRLRLRLAA